MTRRYFNVLWSGINILLLVSSAFLLYGIGWEYSTRSYLRGFADAVVPVQAAPQQKVESILAWMAHGPARNNDDAEWLAQRDPEETLNYEQLLRVCGTATNAFVNLAVSSGLTARRLLLLDPDRNAKHVAAEVWLDGRWAVVDPVFHVLFRDARGQFLTKEQLRDPLTFRQATQNIPHYPPSYSYEQTAIVRLRRIPLIGPMLRPALNAVLPGWEIDFNWTLLLERESFAMALISALAFCCFAMARFLLARHCDRRLGFPRQRLRSRFLRAGAALLMNGE